MNSTVGVGPEHFPCPSDEDFPTNETDPAGEAYVKFHYILNGPTTISLIILGIFCNCICLVAFYTTKSRPCIYYYLIAIVLWDLGLLVVASFMYSIPVLYYGQLPGMGPYSPVFPFAYAASNTTLIGSVWMVVTLTLDRYLAVCKPLWHQAVITRTKMTRTMLAVSVSAFFYALPTFFELEVLSCFDSSTQTLNLLIAPSRLRGNTGYQVTYKIVGSLLFYSAVPFALLLVLTVQISVELHRAWLKRRRMSRANVPNSTEDRGSTMMLILISGKFLVSRLLPTTLDIAETIVGEDNFIQNLVASYFVDFSNFVVVANSATNWLVYIGYGRNFRRKFFQLLSLKKPAEEDEGSISLLQRHHNPITKTNSGRRYSAPDRINQRFAVSVQSGSTTIELNEYKSKSPNELLGLPRSVSFRGTEEKQCLTLANSEETQGFLCD